MDPITMLILMCGTERLLITVADASAYQELMVITDYYG
jgi:hypothetical protein